MLYIGLGDKEQSLSALERAYTAHNLQMAFLGIDLHVDPLSEPLPGCGTVNRDRWVLGTVEMTVDRFRFGSNGDGELDQSSGIWNSVSFWDDSLLKTDKINQILCHLLRRKSCTGKLHWEAPIYSPSPSSRLFPRFAKLEFGLVP